MFKVNNNITINNNITHVNDVVLMHFLLTLNKFLNFLVFFSTDFEYALFADTRNFVIAKYMLQTSDNDAWRKSLSF